LSVKVTKNFIYTMISLPKLNFPRINLSAKEDDGRTMVFDRVRSSYVVLTPEEWVRRHLVEFLISHCHAPLRSVVEEYPIPLNTMAQRADVVVLDATAKPLMLVECKSTDVNLSLAHIREEVFLQATRYNAVLGARYVALTNGIHHFCYERTPSGYIPMRSFPRLG
jgi:hypothetical protein